jgi:hypothetical protein
VFRFILLLSVLLNISYAGNRYFIKLGSFRQFSVLEKTINRMPQNLRSHITIVKSNGWFIPFAYNTTKKYSLHRKLSAYKRYFYDAYIYSSQKILNSPVVRSYGKLKVIPQYQNMRVVKKESSIIEYPLAQTYPIERNSYSVILKPAEIPQPKVKQVTKKQKGFYKRMISGKLYYLAYKSTNNNPNLLIKVTFRNHTVIYQPMIGDMSMREAKYLVENGKLYMFADSFSEEGAFSKIDGYKDNYILVSSWSNGKKINTLRYYYKLNDAKEYLGVKGSTDPLANALEDSPIEGVYLPNY